jgi:ferredoxin-NADP reductase
MPTITFEGKTYDCAADETLLDSLTRHGVLLPSSCRSGVCQTCMLRATKGTPPPASQEGIKDTLKAQNYFLACVCKPQEDMEAGLASKATEALQATVTEKEWLNETVMRIRMQRPDGFTYYPGQFINLVRDEGKLVRSYSLASVASESFLELHIKRVPDGIMSNWLCDELACGDTLEFYGAAGDCFYLPGKPEQPLLLAGTGTGLAPLYGIVRDALAAGHSGEIRIFHASLATAGLYYMDELRALAAAHANVSYTPCVLHGDVPEGGMQGKIDEVLIEAVGDLKGWRMFFCGDPPIVNAMRHRCFMAGASMSEIHADAFVFAPQTG